MSDKSAFKLKKFEDIKVSTKTYIVNTNLLINIHKLFDLLDITEYIVLPKKRGRKKKGVVENPNKDIKYGSIISVKCEGKIKGVELKPKKTTSFFRNSVTVVVIFDKPVNFKVCRNGTFQITGAKNWGHAQECLKLIWNTIKDEDDLFEFTRDSGRLNALIIPSMRNIDFETGFFIDRDKLNKYMREQPALHCLLETSFGYTGVNIKIPIKEDRKNMDIQQITSDKSNNLNVEYVKYIKYLEVLDEKERIRKENEEKYNTFLVFHSGKVIFSGLNKMFMRDTYYDFIKMIHDGRKEIEEKLRE